MRIGQGADFKAQSVTVEALIREAFSLRPFQLSGGPGWIGTEAYDILAKSASLGPSEGEIGRMSDAEREAFKERLYAKVRLMLEDRFQLKVHRETRELPIYGLVIGKSGSKLEPAKDDEKPRGGISTSRDATGKPMVTVSKMPISALVRLLSNVTGRMVVDQTGLSGDFDFKLTWAPDLTQRASEQIGNEPVATASDGPSIFTAVQDQLGLKLESQKGPVGVTVIDAVQRPSEN